MLTESCYKFLLLYLDFTVLVLALVFLIAFLIRNARLEQLCVVKVWTAVVYLKSTQIIYMAFHFRLTILEVQFFSCMFNNVPYTECQSSLFVVK